MSEETEEFVTFAEFADMAGRSVAFFKTDERMATLTDGGAEFGSRGKGSRIPVKLLDTEGWKKAPKAKIIVSSGTDPEEVTLATEIEGLEAEFADAKEKAATYGNIIKEKKAALTKKVKAREREEKKVSRVVLRDKEKELRDYERAAERVRAEIAAETGVVADVPVVPVTPPVKKVPARKKASKPAVKKTAVKGPVVKVEEATSEEVVTA